MKYIDAHCHIDSCNAIPADGDVTHFICNAARASEWDDVVRVARENKNVSGAIGVHPWYAAGVASDWDVRLETLLRQNSSIMIGECGLDRTRQNWDAQLGVFRRHIALANSYNRILHVHCVRAWDVILNVFRVGPRPSQIVAHSFNGGPNIVHALMNFCDVYFSFSPRILSGGVRTENTIRAVPIDRILVESDASPKTSANVLPEIVARIAEIRGLDIPEMSDIIYKNSNRVINNGQVT